MRLLDVVFACDLLIRAAELGRRGGDALGVGKHRTDRFSERVRRDPVISEGFTNFAPLLAESVRIADRPHTGGKDKAKVVRPRSIGRRLRSMNTANDGKKYLCRELELFGWS